MILLTMVKIDCIEICMVFYYEDGLLWISVHVIIKTIFYCLCDEFSTKCFKTDFMRQLNDSMIFSQKNHCQQKYEQNCIIDFYLRKLQKKTRKVWYDCKNISLIW